tara:strand:- start:263 stop:982 length:720 start_codon:yes stop_codon:yes gene_type:complete
MNNFIPFKMLRATFIIMGLSILSACATISDPASATNANYGEYPENYKQVINEFLKQQPTTTLNLDNIEYLNKPNKFFYEHMAHEKAGYRACTLIHTNDKKGLRAHFFLINNGQIVEHLYDSGAIALPNKFCNVQMLALENKAANNTPAVDENGFKYLTCNAADGKEVFFALNPEKHQLVQQHDGQVVANFDITKLSDTFIVAVAEHHRISINRVSGTLLHQHNGTEAHAQCKLTSKQGF